jgi:ribA/ribD-fused uncharacterized protein
MIDNLQGTFLSNFYESMVQHEDMLYRNAESAFQASKCAVPEDRKIFQRLSGSNARRIGKIVTIREDWHDVRVDVMFQIVTAKFTQMPSLMEMLVATGDEEIVEGNYWNDKFWGKCNGEGMNHLGIILMTVRSVNTRREVK